MFNIFVVAVCKTVGGMLFCSLASFCFAKPQFPGRKLLLALYPVTMITPPQPNLTPQLIIMSKLGWFSVLKALIPPGLISAFGIFWMNQYCIRFIHNDLINPARIDGCDTSGLFLRMGLPIMIPDCVFLCIYILMDSWSDYLWSLIVTDDPNRNTLQMALTQLQGVYNNMDCGMVMCSTLLATLPLLVIFPLSSWQFATDTTVRTIKSQQFIKCKVREDRMQKHCNSNLRWRFKKGLKGEYITGGKDGEDQPVNVPHTVKEVPYDCFGQTMTCTVLIYIRSFSFPEPEGERALVSFGGVSAYYDLYVNGHRAGSHKGAYSIALLDITEYVKPGKSRMVLRVGSHKREDTPSNGSTMDFLIYGGTYRDVTLYTQEKIYLKQVLFHHTLDHGHAVMEPELLVKDHDRERELWAVASPRKDGTLAWEKQQRARAALDNGSILLGPGGAGTVKLW